MGQERIDVCKQLDVVETYRSFNHNQHKSYIFTISTTIISIFIHVYKNLNKTAQLTTNEMHAYCKLCIAVCFNEILV